MMGEWSQKRGRKERGIDESMSVYDAITPQKE